MGNKSKNKKIAPRFNQSSVTVSRSEVHIGPLPTPRDLQSYNEILPGAADRIITMTEKQGDHRRTIENKVIDGDISRSKTGIWLGFFLSLVGIVGGYYLILEGKQAIGGAFGFSWLGALVGSLLYTSSKRHADVNRQRQQELGQ